MKNSNLDPIQQQEEGNEFDDVHILSNEELENNIHQGGAKRKARKISSSASVLARKQNKLLT